MAAVPKIPLSERLQFAGAGEPNFLAAFELFADYFFTAIANLTGNPHFESVYHNRIAEYNDENNGCVLSEIIYRASLLEPQKLEVFHAILIEPFAALEERSGP